jgi:ElaB/YqjD/DUF883 family membrane-anchored ribosome-binding protein
MEENMETASTSSGSKSKSPLLVDQANRHGFSEHDSVFPITETFNQLRTKTVEAYDSSIQVVRRNPVKSLAVAIGLGVAAGYFLKRR